MKSFIRKLAITGGAAVVLLAAGGSTAHITAQAAGPTALHCAIGGTASISPGLNAPPGSPQTFSYGGSALVHCTGVLAGTAILATDVGTISGSGSCGVTGPGNGSLATCTQTLPPISCSISFGAKGSLSGNGTYVQAGANITVECSGTDSGGGAVTVEANAVFATTSPPPVQNVTFVGSASAHTS
jgi:hypothetical protein